MTTHDTFKHLEVQRKLGGGGGYSGALTVTAARGNTGKTLIFVDSEF
jgi:hypothetical protein